MSQNTLLTQEHIKREITKNKVAKLFKTAEKYGVIKRGWSCIDYMRYAVDRHGWESTVISGQKGTLKSNLLLQHGNAIYGDMQETIRHLVTKQKQLLQLMEYAIENEIVISWIGVDDVAAIFPKALYFTHRKLYSKLQASWETVRTIMANFECSCVIKNKVATFITQDITGDIKCYNPVFIKDTPIKGHYDYRRWLWLRSLKDPTVDIPKLISVEDIAFPATPESFKYDKELCNGTYYCGGDTFAGEDFFRTKACLVGVDTQKFREYWNERLNIARESFHDFASILEDKKIADAKKERKLTPEERAAINRENGKKGLETQKRLKQMAKQAN